MAADCNEDVDAMSDHRTETGEDSSVDMPHLEQLVASPGVGSQGDSSDFTDTLSYTSLPDSGTTADQSSTT